MLAPRERDDPAERAWQRALQAAVLFAIDPAGLGGVRVRAHAGPVRDAWLALLRQLLGLRACIRVPLGVTDERLLGGLDLPATLSAGRPVLQSGLMQAADGGVLLLAMAERVSRPAAARIAQAMDSRQVMLERDGLQQRQPASFGVVALDEAMDDDEAVAAILCERFAFDLDLRAIPPRIALDGLPPGVAAEVGAAHAMLGRIDAPDSVVEALCGTALALGVASPRAGLLALAAARASAALDASACCTEDDAQIAAALVLAPRATRLPPDDEEAAQPEPQAPSQQQENAASADGSQPLEDRVLDAAQASIPANLLAALLSGTQRRKAAAGKSGAPAGSGLRGRPVGSRRAPPRGQRLHLIDTLRAAAPWQKLRQRGAAAAPSRVQVRSEDFHVVRIRQKTASATVFVVDASGSSAMQRLAEAKGAVELLLAECYVRRDQVALIAFRGRQAELLLPPTRSLTAAKRRLAGLPGGGGTPLASALDAAGALVDAIARRGMSPMVVLMTDGRANVARDGSGGRERAQADALQSARQLALMQAPLLLIDTSNKPQREAAELAQAMRARYLPLPYAGSERVAESVRAIARQEARHLA